MRKEFLKHFFFFKLVILLTGNSLLFAQSTDTDITSFSMLQQTGAATIGSGTISIELDHTANINNWQATFAISAGATADHTSGNYYDWSGGGRTIVVTAEDGTTTQDWIVSVSQLPPPSTDTDITSFSMLQQTGAATIGSGTISIELDHTANINNWQATFAISAGATADHTSGNYYDWSGGGRTIVVTAEDGTTTQDWIVSVSQLPPPSTDTDITSFSMLQQTGAATIGSGTISIELDHTANINNWQATFAISAGATADHTSGNYYDWSGGGRTIVVTAENGTTTQDWIVSVSQLPPPSTDTDITSFSMLQQTGAATIGSGTISIELDHTANINNWQATFAISAGATADHTSGNYYDWSGGGRTIVVTAENGTTTQDWIVSVSQLPPPSTDTDITSFSMLQQTGAATIGSGTISIELDHTANINNWQATFAISAGATADHTSGNYYDWSGGGRTIVVTAENGTTTQDWIVSVSQLPPPSTDTDITSFSMLQQTGAATIGSGTISIELDHTANINNWQATFAISAGATADHTSGNYYDWSGGGRTIVVTAENGTTTQDWIVSVSQLPPPSTDTDITSFSMLQQTGAATIGSGTISIELDHTANINNWQATFAISAGATADHTSGNYYDWSGGGRTIVVTAENGTTTQDWIVSVSQLPPPSTDTDITSFSMLQQTGAATIGSGTISIELDHTANINNWQATFAISAGATADHTSGNYYDWSGGGRTIVVTAENGTTTQDWIVSVSQLPPPSTDTDITSFSMLQQTGAATIGSGTISIELDHTANINNWQATFAISAGATADHTSGNYYDWSGGGRTIVVTAENGTTTQDWIVSVSQLPPPSTDTDITSFSMLQQTGAATIGSGTISIELDHTANINNWQATFAISAGATADHTSGNYYDWSGGGRTIVVTAENGTTTQDWIVSVSQLPPPSTDTDITSFSMLQQTGAATIGSGTISIELDHTANINNWQATFAISAGATADHTSGNYYDWSGGGRTIVVTAENGTTTQDWIVSVSQLPPPSTDTDITSFSMLQQTGAATIGSGTISIELDHTANINNWQATFAISAGATADHTSGNYYDWSGGGRTIVVTAENGTTTQDWIVSVSQLPPPSTDTDITSFSMLQQTGAATIGSGTISIELDHTANINNWQATFAISAGATADHTSGNYYDWSGGGRTIVVTAENGTTTQDWIVSVSQLPPPSTDTDITSFSMLQQTGAATIGSGTISIELDHTANINNWQATFAISAGATADHTSGNYYDWSGGGRTIVVTAENGTTTQDWIVSVSQLPPPSTDTDITSFSMLQQTGAATIGSGTIDIEVEYGTNPSNIPATFTLSQGATADHSSGTNYNWSSPRTIIVTAEDGTTTQNWIVSVSVAGNSENDILTYSLPGQTGPAIVNNGNQTVQVEVPFGTDVTNLVASFSLSPQASATVGATTQVSGSTPNDFNSPVTYAVQAGNGSIQNWIVTVSFAANTENDILTYSLPGQTGPATINNGNHTVLVEVPYGTDISDMTATFTLSPEAEARVSGSLQESGVSSLNFSSPVTYNIIAGDAVTSQDWIVSINFAPNTATDFESFSFPEQTGDAVINSNTNTIYVQVAYGTSLTNLTASFQLSFGATTNISGTQQTSGVTTNNFSTILVYTVIAEDGVSSQDWSVDVLVEPNSATDILSFSLPGEVGNSIVNSGSHSVSVVMPFESDISNMVATFILSDGATATVNGVNQTSGVTSNDFRSALIYTITAENGIDIQDWTIEVLIAPNISTGILLFSFNEISRPSIIDYDNYSVDVMVVYGTEVSDLIPTYILSEGAEASIGGITQQSGITANNFSDLVTYTITAQDGITTQDWIITVRIAQNTKADILEYSFAEQIQPAIIDSIAKEIEIEVAFGTDITNLVATFTLSDNADAKVGVDTQTSGVTPNDFTDVVTYVVTSEDGSLTNVWNVFVSMADNSSAEILSFYLPGQTRDTEIDTQNQIINVEVQYGTDLSELIASFTLSDQAVAYIGPVRQVSDTSANDYTFEITFAVHAGDGITVQEWNIIVTLSTPNTETEIISFSFPEQEYIRFGTTANRHHIHVYVNEEAELDRLIASFVLSKGAYALVEGIIQESGITANDFTDTVTYVVMAQDSITLQDWTVSVDFNFGFEYDQRPDEFPVSQQRISASARLSLNQNFNEVNFYYRKFEEEGWNTPIQVSGNQEIFSMDITRDLTGNLGMFYYFEAVDSLGNGITLPETQMILHYDTVFAEIPDLKFGETVNQYQIISIPLDLQNSNAESVFDELDEYNVKFWRLFRHNGTSTIEYKNGFTDITPGLGYWLIIRESTPITTGEGRTVRLDSITNGYSLNLEPGWNHIGNPFDIDVRWDDVIFDNRNLNIGKVRLYTQDSLTEGNVIPRFRGGFVFLEGEDTINVQLRPEIISVLTRRQEFVDQDRFNSLDKSSWITGLKITNGAVTNTLSGIGMHPEAIEGKDRHDDIVLPVPKEIIPFELAFNHPDEKYDKFSLDVIQTTDQYIWEFEVKSFSPSQTLTINWQNKHFGENDLNLILNHKGSEKLIDMKEVNSYSFHASETNQFRIIFGDDSFIGNHIKPENITFGLGYPNPFRDNVTIPFTLPEIDANFKVTINVYDLTGTLITKLTDDYYRPGYYSISWNPLESSKTIRNGIYIIKMSVQSDKVSSILIRKVLKH